MKATTECRTLQNKSTKSAITPTFEDLIKVPGENDVICGRGKSVAHPGNQRFRQLVLSRKDQYQKAKRRDDKTRITSEIVEILRRGPIPSRFLLRDTKTQMWYDAGEVYAREKVSHALRSRPNEERRRRPKPKKKSSRKPQIPPELEGIVQDLIKEQQKLLKSLIEKEMIRGNHFEAIIPFNAT